MPRQDVPYGGAICRLRERIAEIFDKLGEKLHTINGVPGDGDGNVKIVSGSSAVVISNDPTQNEIAVSLDTSQLPAAAVSSVNGQTGAVALTADDIPSDNGDVQTDLDNLAAADVTLQGNINTEALARQGADSTLQTNINAVSASLPAAAAAAVAADPTVAYISSELSNKVDLSDVSTVETPDTIAKRNGSGRLVAADPASGATDKTLVTANWISQTGNGAPNNLLHRNGNETKYGNLVLPDGIETVPTGWHLVAPVNVPVGYYCIFAKITPYNNGHYTILDFLQASNNANEAGRLALHCWRGATNPIWLFRKSRGGNSNLSRADNIVILDDGTYLYLAWLRTGVYGNLMAKEWYSHFYQYNLSLGSNIEWYDASSVIVTNDLSAYTVTTPID